MTTTRAKAVQTTAWLALTVSLILASASPSQSAPGGFFGEIGFEETWTDNLFLSSVEESDWISRPFLELNLGPFSGLIPYYYASGYLYSENRELNSLAHRAGLDYTKPFGDGRHDFVAGAAYRGAIHVEDTKELDYHQGEADLGFKIRPLPNLMIGPSLSASYLTFPEADDLSFVEAGSRLVVNLSLKSRTTFRLSGRLDYKQFLQEIQTSESEMDSSELSHPSSAGNGDRGNGDGGADGDSGQDGSDRGDMSGKAGQMGSLANTDSVEAAQALFSLRIAQGIGLRVGAYIEGFYRLNLLDPPRYAEGVLPEVDREFFDDRYGYEGPGGEAQVSVILADGLRLIARGRGELREYESREALDEDGLPLSPSEDRSDRRMAGTATLSYSRGFDLAFPASLDLSLSYGYTRNISNDAYYDAEENSASATVSIGW